MTRHKDAVSILQVRRRLVWVWGVGFVLCFTLMLALTIAGTFASSEEETWAWFFPTILPTLGIALGSIVQAPSSQRQVSIFTARLSVVVSVIYILIVLATLLAWPFAGTGPLMWFRTSGLWLGPIQGVTSAVLTVLLTRREEGIGH
jgi:hypothetical protein